MQSVRAARYTSASSRSRPMAASKSIDETEGVVKIVGDAKTDRLLGVQILERTPQT